MKKLVALALAASFCAMSSNVAEAAPLAQVRIIEGGTLVASWEQEFDPVPIAYVPNYYVTVAVFNSFGLGGDTEVTWYDGAHLGGFTNFSENHNLLAAQEYIIADSFPHFTFSSFDGVDLVTGMSSTIIISPVPGPTAWTMMIIGLGVVGAAIRRRVRKAVSFA